METVTEKNPSNESLDFKETRVAEVAISFRAIEILRSKFNGEPPGSPSDRCLRNQAVVALGQSPSLGADGVALVMKEILFSNDSQTHQYGINALLAHSPQLAVALAHLLRRGDSSSFCAEFLDSQAPEAALSANIRDIGGPESGPELRPFARLAASHPGIALSIGKELLGQELQPGSRRFIEKSIAGMSGVSPVDFEQIHTFCQLDDFISLVEYGLDSQLPSQEQLAALEKFVSTYKEVNFPATFALLFTVIESNGDIAVREYALESLVAIAEGVTSVSDLVKSTVMQLKRGSDLEFTATSIAFDKDWI
jgi:hypothetical protein